MGNAKSKASNKGKQTNKLAVVGGVVVALLFVCCIILSVIVDTGVTDRSKIVMSTNNYKVNGSMLKYFYNAQVNTFYNQYYSIASYLGLDFSKSFKDQLCSMTEDANDTWFDYFMDITTSEIEQYLVYCEAANAAGIKLEDDDIETIEKAIDAIETSANSNGYSLSGYITAAYGSGVKEKDVRNCLELIQLYAKYAEIKYDEIKDSVTDDDVDKQVKDYITNYLVADYMSFTWTATNKELKEADYETTEEYEAAKKEAEEKYEALKAKYDGYAETLKATETYDAFKEALEKIIHDEEYETLKESEYTKRLEEYKDENKDATDAEAEEAVLKEIEEDVKETVETAMEKALTEGGAYNITSDLGKWIFGTEVKNVADDDDESDEDEDDKDEEDEEPVPAAKEGDIFTNATSEEDEEESGKYTVTVAYLVKASALDESPTKNVGHILFEADDDDEDEMSEAKKEAQKILDEYLAGELTKDAFEKLGEEYTADSSVFYEGVKEGTMEDNFNDWLFSLGDYEGVERKIGDTGLVETSYGWHIMYYNGDGHEYWYECAKSDFISAEMEDWFEAKSEEFKVTVNDKAISNITL